MYDKIGLRLTTHSEAYSPEDCGKTITVGELMEILSGYNDDTPVYFYNEAYRCSTYGRMRECDIEEVEIDEEEEDDE